VVLIVQQIIDEKSKSDFFTNFCKIFSPFQSFLILTDRPKNSKNIEGSRNRSSLPKIKNYRRG